jgi:hypothetical protein
MRRSVKLIVDLRLIDKSDKHRTYRNGMNSFARALRADCPPSRTPVRLARDLRRKTQIVRGLPDASIRSFLFRIDDGGGGRKVLRLENFFYFLLLEYVRNWLLPDTDNTIKNMTRGLSPSGDMGKRHPLQASALRPNAATISRTPFVSCLTIL